MASPRRVLLLVVLSLLTACGGARYETRADYPAPYSIAPVRAAGGPEVTELQGRFFNDEIVPDALEPELIALLRRYPHDAELHEMAALLATLEGDDEAMFRHYLHAAADLKSPFTELYLSLALSTPQTVRRRQASIALLGRLLDAHPRPAARHFIRRRLIGLHARFGDLTEARSLSRELGVLERFQIVGSFDNDQGKGFRARYAPEEQIDLDATMQGVLLPVRWRPVERLDKWGDVPIAHLVSPNGGAVAYLATWVRSDTARTVDLRITTPVPVRAWVNDALVASEETVDHAGVDNVVATVQLSAGWNQLLIKAANRAGRFWLGARLTDRRGASLRDLEQAHLPHPFDASDAQPDREIAASPAQRRAPDELSAIELDARRHLLTYFHYRRMGFEREALEAVQAYLDLAGSHPLARYFGALGHWDHQELGRAIDLLNAGVASSGPWAHAFLLKRARFYRQKELWDKAVADLHEVIERNPGGLAARLALAKVFSARGWEVDRCRALEGILARWPDATTALRGRGDCSEERGYYDRAEHWYRRAHALEPGHEWTLRALARLAERRQDFDEAIQRRRRLVEIAPTNAGYVVWLGDTYRRAGRSGEATEMYAKAAAMDHGWSRPHYRLAHLAYERGNDADAVESWQAALERNPDDSYLAERLDYLRSDRLEDADELAPSDRDIARAVATAETIDVHPGAHSVLLLDDEVTRVRHDGSAKRLVTQVHMAATTEGRDHLIRSRVPRDARILKAYSRSPEGQRQEASSIRGGAIRFRGLETGSIVVLQYIHYSSPPRFLPNHYVSQWWFQGIHRQTVRARWALLVPPHRELATHALGDIAHETRDLGGMKAHVFTARDVPPVIAESHMPPAADVAWNVSVSTLTGWQEYVEWERALLSEVFKTDPALSKLARELTDGVEGTRAKFDKLYHYVAQEIRYEQDYENTIAGVRPHSCPVVLERGYGDCKDKAVLLILLAQEVGIDVDFAILRTRDRGEVRRSVPNQQFNHAIVYVPAQDGIEDGFFIDPTTDALDVGNLRSDDQGVLSLVLDPDRGEHRFLRIPFQPPRFQRTDIEMDVAIESASEATAHAKVQMRGRMAAGVRRLLRNPERAKTFFDSFASSTFGGAKVLSTETSDKDDLWNPLRIELEMDVAAAVEKQGDDRRRIALPDRFGLTGATRLERRTTTMKLGPPDEYEMQVTYTLPRGARVPEAPAELAVEHDCFQLERTVQLEGRRVGLTTRYRRTCTEVSIDAYPAFREAVQRAGNLMQGHLLFEVPVAKARHATTRR